MKGALGMPLGLRSCLSVASEDIKTLFSRLPEGKERIRRWSAGKIQACEFTYVQCAP